MTAFRKGPGGGRARILIHALVTAAIFVCAVALVENEWLNRHVNAHVSEYAPLTHRFAGYQPDQAGPAFHTQLDVDALRRAVRALPRSAQYLVVTSDAPLVYTDVVSAGRIFAPWAIPVSALARADWVLAYATPLVRPPKGFTSVQTWGSLVYLGKVRR